MRTKDRTVNPAEVKYTDLRLCDLDHLETDSEAINLTMLRMIAQI